MKTDLVKGPTYCCSSCIVTLVCRKEHGKFPLERRADRPKVSIRGRVRIIMVIGTPEYARSDNLGLSDGV